jgi:hypothetical protein
MSKANVDPAELRRFANDLKRFTADLESLLGQPESGVQTCRASADYRHVLHCRGHSTH